MLAGCPWLLKWGRALGTPAASQKPRPLGTRTPPHWGSQVTLIHKPLTSGFLSPPGGGLLCAEERGRGAERGLSSPATPSTTPTRSAWGGRQRKAQEAPHARTREVHSVLVSWSSELCPWSSCPCLCPAQRGRWDQQGESRPPQHLLQRCVSHWGLTGRPTGGPRALPQLAGTGRHEPGSSTSVRSQIGD